MTITYMVDVYRMGDQQPGHLEGMEPTGISEIFFIRCLLSQDPGRTDRSGALVSARLRDKISFEPARTTEGWQLILQGLLKDGDCRSPGPLC